MKKLLLFLSVLVSFNICFAQKKVVIKGSQLSISSLAPMASFSIVGNNTGSPATPVAISLGIGLTFDHGLLAVDTAHFKDTIFAVNGLSIIGASFNTVGLGGRLMQATNVSGANLFGLTYDSFPAASGRGFRVNFLNDVGWDLFTRDSATGYWTRIPKGAPGQSLVMLSTGGIGWATISAGGSLTLTTTGTSGAATLVGTTLNIPIYGSGGSPVLTRVNITSGTSSTIPQTNSLVKFNFSAPISAYTLTMPASPSDQDVIEIQAGPTITLGQVEVTTLTMAPNIGQTLYFNPNILLNAGGRLRFTYNATGTYWDQAYAH